MPTRWFGETIGNVGDLDGDGYPELLIISRQDAQPDVGVGLIARGGPLGFAPGYTRVPEPRSESLAGRYVFSSGDVNADGFADVAIQNVSTPGAAIVYFGSAVGLTAAARTNVESVSGMSDCCTVSIPGDLDGDGFDDLLVGSSASRPNDPRAFVFGGNSGGIVTAPSAILIAPDGAGSSFGSALASADHARGSRRRQRARRM